MSQVFSAHFLVGLKTARLTIACTRRQIRRQKHFFHHVGIFCRQVVAKKKWDNVKNVCRVKKQKRSRRTVWTSLLFNAIGTIFLEKQEKHVESKRYRRRKSLSPLTDLQLSAKEKGVSHFNRDASFFIEKWRRHRRQQTGIQSAKNGGISAEKTAKTGTSAFSKTFLYHGCLWIRMQKITKARISNCAMWWKYTFSLTNCRIYDMLDT